MFYYRMSDYVFKWLEFCEFFSKVKEIQLNFLVIVLNYLALVKHFRQLQRSIKVMAITGVMNLVKNTKFLILALLATTKLVAKSP